MFMRFCSFEAFADISLSDILNDEVKFVLWTILPIISDITDVCALMFLLIKWLFLVMCYISCDGLTDDVLFFFYVYLYIGCDTLIDDILFFGPFW